MIVFVDVDGVLRLHEVESAGIGPGIRIVVAHRWRRGQSGIARGEDLDLQIVSMLDEGEVVLASPFLLQTDPKAGLPDGRGPGRGDRLASLSLLQIHGPLRTGRVEIPKVDRLPGNRCG